MFFREKTQSIFIGRASTARPLSQATDTFETEFEDDSDLEDGSVPKRSFESVSDICNCATFCMWLTTITGRQPSKKSNNNLIN